MLIRGTTTTVDIEPYTDYVFSLTADNGIAEGNFSNKLFVLPRPMILSETFELHDAPAQDEWNVLRIDYYDAAEWPFIRQHLAKVGGAMIISVEGSKDLVSWHVFFSVPRSGEVIPAAFYKLETP